MRRDIKVFQFSLGIYNRRIKYASGQKEAHASSRLIQNGACEVIMIWIAWK